MANDRFDHVFVEPASFDASVAFYRGALGWSERFAWGGNGEPRGIFLAAPGGAARALGLDHEIGSFENGGMADLALWEWAHGPVATVRDAAARSLHERVFAWMTLADERNLRAAFVAGHQRFRAKETA